MAKVADLAQQVKAQNERLGLTPKNNTAKSGKTSRKGSETPKSGTGTNSGTKPIDKGSKSPKTGPETPKKGNPPGKTRKKDKKRTTLTNVNTSKKVDDHRKGAKDEKKPTEKPKDPPKVKEWYESFGGISKKMSISGGNKKLGQVPYLSLPPGETCSKEIPCYDMCYAQKQTGMLASVQSGYKKNLDFWKSAPDDFWKGLKSWIKLKGDITMFRFHTAGDIPSQEYLDGLIKLVAEHKDIVFILFTKKYDLKFPTPAKLPGNLVLIFSMWPDLKFPKKLSGYSRAWIEGDPRIPAKAMKLYGTCDYFGLDMRGTEWDIIFRKI